MSRLIVLSVLRPKWCPGSSGLWLAVWWRWMLCFSQSGRLWILSRSKIMLSLTNFYQLKSLGKKSILTLRKLRLKMKTWSICPSSGSADLPIITCGWVRPELQLGLNIIKHWPCLPCRSHLRLQRTASHTGTVPRIRDSEREGQLRGWSDWRRSNYCEGRSSKLTTADWWECPSITWQYYASSLRQSPWSSRIRKMLPSLLSPSPTSSAVTFPWLWSSSQKWEMSLILRWSLS